MCVGAVRLVVVSVQEAKWGWVDWWRQGGGAVLCVVIVMTVVAAIIAAIDNSFHECLQRPV